MGFTADNSVASLGVVPELLWIHLNRLGFGVWGLVLGVGGLGIKGLG